MASATSSKDEGDCSSPPYSSVSVASTHARAGKSQDALSRIWRRCDRWWEAGGLALSILSTFAIVAILARMSNESLSYWWFPMQINSLVALFSTITKSALLVTVAEGLGQLKWLHFEHRRPLSHLQAFDDASRGPWGAFMFFWRTRGTTTLSAAGALIAILAPFTDPFVQQVVEFSSRNVALSNLTGSVIAADSWLTMPSVGTNGMNSQWKFNTGVLSLLDPAAASITNRFDAYCPTSHCTIPSFSSLAVCSICEKVNVTGSEHLNFTFTITVNADSGSPNLTLYYSSHSEFSKTLKTYSPADLARASIASQVWYFVPSSISPTNLDYYPPLLFQSMVGLAEDICNTTTRTKFNAVGSADARSFIYHETIASFAGGALYSGKQPSDADDPCQAIHIQLTKCHIDFCVQQYQDTVIENGIIRFGDKKSLPLIETNMTDLSSIYFFSPDTNTTFAVSGDVRDKIINMPFSFPYSDSVFTDYIISTDQMPQLMDAFATYITNIFATRRNPDARNVTGAAYGPDLYVRVRWPWLIMPLSMVIFTGAFLINTITQSRRRPYRYKSSIVALLLHGLDGWTDKELEGLEIKNSANSHSLTRAARTMQVALQKNEAGRLKFIKED
ncbi:hypothetical protein BDV96DRAFT_688637 [Lophiotrema nucula]|uniref:Uncharacterized protein n=1 Tax=Lophiotrema nucula TaxID=690887 RepID=A0A6A5Z3M9_9PLEO|nr:hypothetical protein BDV96DRAFT_688637 [Lophiotrema nucula]